MGFRWAMKTGAQLEEEEKEEEMEKGGKRTRSSSVRWYLTRDMRQTEWREGEREGRSADRRRSQ